MKYLGYEVEELEKLGGIHTAREINNQPELWKKSYQSFLAQKNKILDYLKEFWSENDPQIILTGAGTSAFIGNSLEGIFQKRWNILCRGIGTTEILTHPENYLIKSKPTLLISFARSGDSPESVAVVELAREFCDNLYEMNITCNKDGELAKKSGKKKSLVFLLPEETNDQSLAMTSSFSSMLLIGLLIAYIHNRDEVDAIVENINKLGNHILQEYLPVLKEIAGLGFNRMVFLGSGPLTGLARESHLKVQELSDGNVICKHDSFLGFRHGPKAVVNESTVIVYLLENNPYSKLYGLDLIRSVIQTNAGETSLVIGNGFDRNEFKFNYSIQFPEEINDIPDDFLSVFYILPAQIIGFYKSVNIGLSPDNPSKRGSITRVVQGVNIYKP